MSPYNDVSIIKSKNNKIESIGKQQVIEDLVSPLIAGFLYSRV